MFHVLFSYNARRKNNQKTRLFWHIDSLLSFTLRARRWMQHTNGVDKISKNMWQSSSRCTRHTLKIVIFQSALCVTQRWWWCWEIYGLLSLCVRGLKVLTIRSSELFSFLFSEPNSVQLIVLKTFHNSEVNWKTWKTWHGSTVYIKFFSFSQARL